MKSPSKGGFHMKLSDKIVGLRKSNGMSQEDLAEKLDVSRQAISRWESGAAMPDANNILQLSKLFDVTTDYLLNDDYQSDNDLPKIKEVQNDNLGQIMIYLVTLEVMILLMQFMTMFILQNVFFAFLSFLPFVAAIGGFEYAYQKKVSSATEKTKDSSTNILLSTGASDDFSKQGIYDLAGNVWEWTLEYTSYSSIPCASRGGNYRSDGSTYPAACRFSSLTTNYNNNIGFRVSLY